MFERIGPDPFGGLGPGSVVASAPGRGQCFLWSGLEQLLDARFLSNPDLDCRIDGTSNEIRVEKIAIEPS